VVQTATETQEIAKLLKEDSQPIDDITELAYH
jgi:hypothetical protein